MKSSKPIWITLLTLIVGFMLGVLANRYFMAYRFQKMSGQSIRKEFRMMFFQDIELTPEQEEKIEPILERHFESMEESRREFRVKVDSLYISLEPILTPDQLEKLRDKRRKFRRPGGPRKHRKRRSGQNDGDMPPPPLP